MAAHAGSESGLGIRAGAGGGDADGAARAAADGQARLNGHIVLISSTAGQRGEANHADYAVTKGALISLTKSLSSELAPRGIRVNCVAPGWVATEMSAAALGDPETGTEDYGGHSGGPGGDGAGDCRAGAVFVHAAGGIHQRRSAEREWRRGAGGIKRHRMETKVDAESFGGDAGSHWCWLRRDSTRTQTADDAAAQNAQKARAALDAMVQAMGGPAWLNMKNQMRQGHVAAFFHGQPDLGTKDLWEFHAWPDHDRIELTKHRDVVEFYVGSEGWEVTYRGKKPIPQEGCGRLSAAARPLH